jgi:hypothetical protein
MSATPTASPAVQSVGPAGVDRFAHAEWRQSAQSGPWADRVEVAFADGLIGVRSTESPEGPVLVFTPSEWDAFVNGAKDGEFDV